MKNIFITALCALVAFVPTNFAVAAPAVTATCTAVASADATCTANVDFATGFSWHVMIAGSSPSGVLYLQASNDNSTWENITSVTISADATQLWNVSDAQYRFTRVFWDRTSGGLTFVAYHNNKAGK